jgi:EcsC protein family
LEKPQNRHPLCLLKTMDEYQELAISELKEWKKEMQRKQRPLGMFSRQLQTRINKIIPESVHEMITAAIRQMTTAVLTGAKFTTPGTVTEGTLQEREVKVDSKIKLYSRTAAAEGAVTGAGGILLGLADFPLWLMVKMKLLFEIAAAYGHDVSDFKERLYILHIFELTFSGQARRRELYAIMKDWDKHVQSLPVDHDQFDWRKFQQEYRDYIDVAKLLQLVPGIGAPIGAIVNLRLTKKLGRMAKNSYRLRAGLG